MTFLVNLTFDIALPLEMSICLHQLAQILAIVKMKTFNPFMPRIKTFYIGFKRSYL